MLLRKTTTTTKPHVIAIFFDLEKTYHTTWKHGILSKLYDLDFRNHVPTIVDGFLSNRLLQMKDGATLSDTNYQEIGVPQGSILSLVHFSLKIKNVAVSLKGSEESLFVDDLPYVYAQSPSRAQTYAALCKQCTGLGL